MRRIIFPVLVAFIFLASSSLSAQQDIYNQKKVLRDVEIQVGNPKIYFDYMPVLGETLRRSVLANIEKKIFPLVIVPIKVKNVSQEKNFYELLHKIKADIIIYDQGSNAIGGFEAFFYLTDESEDTNSPRRHRDSLEIFVEREAEYIGQVRTASYPDKDSFWFLKPTIKPDMEVYAKIAISVDGFEAMYFTTAPVKVGIAY